MIDAITIAASPTARHQQAIGDALELGFVRHGVKVYRVWHNDMVRTDTVACWGWRNGKCHRAKGRNVLVMERAYMADRFKWVSLGWNGLNGRATFPEVDDGGRRFRQHFGGLLRENDGDEHVLLVGQVKGDQSLNGLDLAGWYAKQAYHAADVYGLPVVFRPHPVSVQRHQVYDVPGTIRSTATLEHDLAGAAAVITYNSNTGVDAVLAGCRTVTMDVGAMAYPVTDHCIGAYGDHDRETWAHRMAYKQWLPYEVASGEAIEHLLEALP